MAHQMFEERCYFYVIAGRDNRGNPLVQKLLQLLDSLDIASAMTSVVLGPYDVVLRVWLSSDQRKRLFAAFKDETESLGVSSLLEFAVDDTDYDWWKYSRVVDVREETVLSLVRRVAESANAGGPEDQATVDAVAALKNLDLLREHTFRAGTKFFLFVSRRNRRTLHPEGLVNLVTTQAAHAHGVEDLSIYDGVGFCDHLVKGVVNSYFECLPVIEKIQADLARYDMDAWTLVPADYGSVPEGENVTPPRIEDAPYFSKVRDISDDPASIDDRLRRLWALDVADIEPILKDCSLELRNPRMERRFAEVIASALSERREDFNRSLSFLTSIEGDLRYIIPRVVVLSGRTDDVAQLLSLDDQTEATAPAAGTVATEGSAFPRRSAVERATLSSLLIGLRRLEREDQSISKLLREYLPSDWAERSRRVNDLRNDFAHGRIPDGLSVPGNPALLSDILLLIARSISLQIGLESLRRRVKGELDSQNT